MMVCSSVPWLRTVAAFLLSTVIVQAAPGKGEREGEREIVNITFGETREVSSNAALFSAHRVKRTHKEFHDGRCQNRGGGGFTCADRASREEVPHTSKDFSLDHPGKTPGTLTSYYGVCRHWNYNQAKCDNSYVQDPDTGRVYFCKQHRGGGGCGHSGMCDVYVDQGALTCPFPGKVS